MKEKIESYIVSSANWEFEIDDLDSRSAAQSGLFFAFGKFNKDLLLSTVIMVNDKSNHINGCIQSADFYASYDILNDLGLDSISKDFLEFTKTINEVKNI